MSNPKELRTYRRVVLSLVRERADQPYSLGGPDAAVRLVRDVIGTDPREHLVAVYLDTKHRPLAVHEVSIGTVNQTSAAPREVFGPALMLAATSVVVAHNHPSGDPTPSQEDRALTDRLRLAGELLGVPLLHHLVIGEARYYSFAHEEFLPLP